MTLTVRVASLIVRTGFASLFEMLGLYPEFNMLGKQ